jgi:hypothetical protein
MTLRATVSGFFGPLRLGNKLIEIAKKLSEMNNAARTCCDAVNQ